MPREALPPTRRYPSRRGLPVLPVPRNPLQRFYPPLMRGPSRPRTALPPGNVATARLGALGSSVPETQLQFLQGELSTISTQLESATPRIADAEARQIVSDMQLKAAASAEASAQFQTQYAQEVATRRDVAARVLAIGMLAGAGIGALGVLLLRRG